GACVSAVRDYGLPMMDRCYFWRPTHLSPEEGFFADVSRRLFRECTAVICQKEELAWLLIRALKGMGVSVPEDFAVLCFAERESRGAEIQAMERLVCGEASLGRTAAEKLQNMISGKPESGMEFSWTLQKR
ncbi:MAG: substrate-binding domain-containing protein, partial [Clostridiales bacterium]|nr:substrate-binding domain-containing protein [Clostridiales bacterium]